MFFANAAVAAAFVAVANAHMKMSSPSPFNPTALNNAPLAADGSDFPCKFGGGYTAGGGTANQYKLGSDQTLSFVGTAVHGGGSCQVVMTYDESPTKDSKWKVIHSIEGGCPARDTPGNLEQNDANLADPFTYPYSIPSDIPAGKGTIAFTWFNKIGNREMYMNCGALELTGDGGSQSNFDALPDMVVLNIGGAETKEGFDYVFENPGKSVEVNGAGPFVVCNDDGCGEQVTGTPSGSSGGSGSGSSAPATSAAPSSTAAPASTPAASSPGGVFITVGSGSSSAAPTSVAATPTSAPASATSVPVTMSTAVSSSAPAATPTPSSGTGSGSSSGAMTGACSTEGQWNCISGSSFQQCASGQWSAVMQMASGTKCTAGQSTALDIKAGKRSHARAFRA